MNDSMKCSNGLLVLRFQCHLTQEQTDQLIQAITPTAEALGVEPMVLGNGADVRIEANPVTTLERICVALEKIAAQGEPPEIGEPEPSQGLNRRG